MSTARRAGLGKEFRKPTRQRRSTDRRFIEPVDIVIFKTCRMDEDGNFNFSAANFWHRAIIERARLVIVEVTDGNPYVYGEHNGVHVSEVDYIIEGDNRTLEFDVLRSVDNRLGAMRGLG